MLRESILLLFILTAASYSIEGNWTLTSARYIDVGSETIVLSISDYIFKGQSILQKLIFQGCEQMMLQAQFSEGQLFINGKSYYRQAIGNATCSSNVLNKIYSVLNSVFFFEINIDVLLFNDAYGNNVMSFKRRVASIPANITGIWNMNQFGTTQTSLSVQISNTQITLCQGNLIFNYKLTPNQNVITLTTVQSNCSSQNLTKAVSASKYFRLNHGILNLYDSTVTLVVGLVYSTTFDPAKPIFNAQPSPTSSSSSNSQSVSVNQPISTSNLIGTWSISSLFNIPFPSSPYSIVFTASTIKLNGGCNNYTANYSINSTTQLITVANPTPSITSACSQSDDQLYVSGITKLWKYLLSNTNGNTILNFYDQTGNIVYALRSATSQAVPRPQTTAASTAKTAAAAGAPLAPGTYLLLLLSRRDLPRLLVNVTANILTYKSCNNIRQTFTPERLTAKNGSITFTGGPTSNSTCTINNDQLYYGSLNLAKSYSFDASANAVVLSNAAGVQIATLSAAS